MKRLIAALLLAMSIAPGCAFLHKVGAAAAKLCGPWKVGHSWAVRAYPLLDAHAMADPAFAAIYGPLKIAIEAGAPTIDSLCAKGASDAELAATIAKSAADISRLAYLYGQVAPAPRETADGRAEWLVIATDMSHLAEQARTVERGAK